MKLTPEQKEKRRAKKEGRRPLFKKLIKKVAKATRQQKLSRRKNYK